MADMEYQQVVYFDSIANHHDQNIHTHILDYLTLEHQQKLGKSLPSPNWKTVKGYNPVQLNGIDCGVFVCTIAEYLARDASFNFQQKHMPSFRKLIFYELSIQQLVTIDADEENINEEIDRIIYNFLNNRLI